VAATRTSAISPSDQEPDPLGREERPSPGAPGSRFRFVQFEFPWSLGPDDGRYVLRRHAGEDPDHVLVLRTLGAPERRRLRRRRPRSADPEPEPTPVATTRATVIDAVPVDGDDAAKAWLDAADRDTLVEDALARLNRVLHLHRVSVADASAPDVTRGQALVVRLGYGAGEEVADGRWTAALELPEPRERGGRTAVLRPQERLAALLSGRDAALACEALAQRARADLAAGRVREATLTVRPALEAALSELGPWTGRGDLERRVEELAGLRDEVAAAYERALQGGLDADEAERVEHALGRLEAALRARTAGGID
jgi:hypothetical protein